MWNFSKRDNVYFFENIPFSNSIAYEDVGYLEVTEFPFKDNDNVQTWKRDTQKNIETLMQKEENLRRVVFEEINDAHEFAKHITLTDETKKSIIDDLKAKNISEDHYRIISEIYNERLLEQDETTHLKKIQEMIPSRGDTSPLSKVIVELYNKGLMQPVMEMIHYMATDLSFVHNYINLAKRRKYFYGVLKDKDSDPIIHFIISVNRFQSKKYPGKDRDIICLHGWAKSLVRLLLNKKRTARIGLLLLSMIVNTTSKILDRSVSVIQLESLAGTDRVIDFAEQSGLGIDLYKLQSKDENDQYVLNQDALFKLTGSKTSTAIYHQHDIIFVTQSLVDHVQKMLPDKEAQPSDPKRLKTLNACLLCGAHNKRLFAVNGQIKQGVFCGVQCHDDYKDNKYLI